MSNSSKLSEHLMGVRSSRGIPTLRSRFFPVPGYRVTGGSEPGHMALDIKAPAGTTVVAVEGGIVTRVQDLARGYGRHIEIRTPSGIEVVYAHLQDFAVRVGQVVKGGQPIGRVGSTGASSGPHLHLEVQRPGAEIFHGGRSAGTAIDPNAFLRGAVSKSVNALKSLAAVGSTTIPKLISTPMPPPTTQSSRRSTSGGQPATQVDEIFDPYKIIKGGESLIEPRKDEEGKSLDVFGIEAFANKYIRRSAFFFAGMVLIVVGLFMLSAGLREKAGPTAMKAVRVVGGAAVGGPAGAAAGAIT